MKHYILFSVMMISGWLSCALHGQQFPITDHYLINQSSLNPTFSGVNGGSGLFLNYRRDWARIEGSPETFRLNTFVEMGEKVVLGGEIFMDHIDFSQLFRGQLHFVYKLQMADEQFLHFGMWGSFYQNSVNYDQIRVDDDTDPLAISGENKLWGNAGFSLIYQNANFTLGFGMPNMLRHKEAYLIDQVPMNIPTGMETDYLFHAGYDFVNKETSWTLSPGLVVRHTTHQPSIVDVTFIANHGQKFWMAALYRNTRVLGLGVGFGIGTNLLIHYSYELGLAGLSYQSGGSHELSLGIKFVKKDRRYDTQKTPRTKKTTKRVTKQKYMLHEYQQQYEEKYRRK